MEYLENMEMKKPDPIDTVSIETTKSKNVITVKGLDDPDDNTVEAKTSDDEEEENQTTTDNHSAFLDALDVSLPTLVNPYDEDPLKDKYDEEAGECDLVKFVVDQLTTANHRNPEEWLSHYYEGGRWFKTPSPDFNKKPMSYQRTVVNRTLSSFIGMFKNKDGELIDNRNVRMFLINYGDLKTWQDHITNEIVPYMVKMDEELNLKPLNEKIDLNKESTISIDTVSN
jgi:hypothetical protein